MYCKHCGKQIDDDSAFCRYCGKPQDLPMEEDDQESKISLDKRPDSSLIKVEIVSPSIMTEDKAKKGVKNVMKEIALITLFVGIAFGSKALIFDAINSSYYPEVTSDEQEAFNNAIMKKQFPNGFPPVEDIINGKWDRNRYPEVTNISFGVEAAKYLHWGDFKYDKEATSLRQLEDLNQFRKDSLYIHASDTAELFFWILLIGLPLLRYIILLIKWLSEPCEKSNSPIKNPE